ncbi:hypothetical protein LCGC14_1917460 [marine sediment metagenome]|uniref:Uncharacterized protein n=1 Tax=marine sediment metagenome TaxID=412755 RepID=A0A0F9I5S1_9ZZZZ
MAFHVGSDQVLQDWLKAAGIPFDNARRIIIDICIDDIVKVYVEGYSDGKILEVTPPEIGWVERPPEEQAK